MYYINLCISPRFNKKLHTLAHCTNLQVTRKLSNFYKQKHKHPSKLMQ